MGGVSGVGGMGGVGDASVGEGGVGTGRNLGNSNNLEIAFQEVSMGSGDAGLVRGGQGHEVTSHDAV